MMEVNKKFKFFILYLVFMTIVLSGTASHRLIRVGALTAEIEKVSEVEFAFRFSLDRGNEDRYSLPNITSVTGKQYLPNLFHADLKGSDRDNSVSNVTAIAGRPFTISCSFSGYPVRDVHFLKDGKKLQVDDRHSTSSLAKLHFNAVSKDDSGAYTCVLTSMAGEEIQGIINLRVVAGPVMSPFVFPDNLEEGMRTSVVCSVVAGDPPITLSWFKDGVPIDDLPATMSQSIQIVAITEFVSSLTIKKLDRRFSGNYTCLATSEVAAVNHTARMTVRFQPIWLLKPSSMSAVTGMGIRLDCLADGYPHPVVRWKMVRTDTTASTVTVAPVVILSSPRIHVLENGSLIIKIVQTEDQGRFTCELSNGVGKSQEASADISVFEAPTVRSSAAQVTIKQMERVELVCKAEGSPPLTFSWYKNGHHLQDINSPKALLGSHYSVREETNTRDKVSVLGINFASRNDSSVYSCRASNYYGSDRSEMRVIVQEPPEAPTDLHAIEVTSRTVTLSWKLAFNGNSPVNRFEVVHKLSQENWSEGKSMFISSGSVGLSPSSASQTTSISVPNLSPLTSYSFRVRAENDLGKSDFSSEITLTTTIEAPQIVPVNVSVVPLDSKSMKVTWNLLSSPELLFIEGFYVGFRSLSDHRSLSSTESFTYKTMHILTSTSSSGRQTMNHHKIRTGVAVTSDPESEAGNRKYEYIVDSLRKSTKYSVIVQAFNSKGGGPSSPEITVETYASDPPKAPSIRIEGITQSTVLTSWRLAGEIPSGSTSVLPSSSNDGISGFILSYKKDEDGSYETVSLPKHQRKYLVSNLACGTKYTLKIMAFNEVGNGESTNDLHFSTDGRPPQAPDKYNFIRSNISSISLNLLAWKDGGCPISNFIIQFKPKSQPEWILVSSNVQLDQESLVIRDLSPGQWHDLLVFAKNEAGTTEANYVFATLAKNGATIAPMLLADHGFGLGSRNPLEAVMVLIPSICAIFVLIFVASILVYVLLCKKRFSDSNDDHYGRHANDTMSLNSFNKSAKGDPIYDHHRVQVYFPSVYGTTTAAGDCNRIGGECNRTAALVRTSTCEDSSLTEYGFSPQAASGTSTRVTRSKHSLDGRHLYDVPHRFRKEFLATACNSPADECPLNSGVVWQKTSSKELILEDLKSETPNTREILEMLQNR